MIFLLIIDYLGISHDAIWPQSFPSLPKLAPNPCDPLKKKKKKKTCQLCVALSFSQQWAPEKTESFLTFTPARNHRLWRATLQHPYQNFWELSLMTSFYGCYFLSGWGAVQVGLVTEAFYAPLSQLCVSSHWYHCKRSFLVLYSQWLDWSWVSTWFLAIAWTSNIHVVSSISMCQGPSLGLQWQYAPHY